MHQMSTARLPIAQLFLVVESQNGQVGETSLLWVDLASEGTLRTSLWPHGLHRGPFEAYVELANHGPGFTRRRISNIVTFDRPSR